MLQTGQDVVKGTFSHIMDNRIRISIALFIPLVLMAGGSLGTIHLWKSIHAVPDVEARLPGQDERPAQSLPTENAKPLTGKLVRFSGKASELAGSWPRFRGPGYDAVSSEPTPLAVTWPETGPAVLWSLDTGEGFAGAAIHGGCVYLMDYDRDTTEESIRCVSLDNGEEIWRYTYVNKIKRNHGMTRTVPTVTDDYIVAMGSLCRVTCLNTRTGELLWTLDLVKDYDTKVPLWYTSQCPLVENGKVILAPGGSCLIMAVDCGTGKVLWETPNPDHWDMTHNSLLPMTFAGKHFYVYCGGSTSAGGVVGVSAEDGSVLWRTDEWRLRTNVPMPVPVGDDRLFLTAGYGQTQFGCAMLKLTEQEGRIDVSTEFMAGTDVFGSMQQTPILYEDHLYGVGMDNQLACLDLTGQVLWRSSSVHTFGYGAYMMADNKLFVIDDDGLLTLVKPSPDGYQPLAQAEVFKEGVECWGPMAMASGRLIVRDLTRVICLDVGSRDQGSGIRD
ncbi:MAG: PQQ-like beta-propeller repeat protein [Phycisphaerae bacterium]|nr:PQQ-like beta-propeller repeat protein [Phycisphaerae bacterium]